MDGLSEVLQCPSRRVPVRPLINGRVGVDELDTGYPVREGIIDFLCASEAEAAGGAQAFYEDEGWGDHADGEFGDTRAFMDTRSAPFAFTMSCLRRLARHFDGGGKFLLDAGSGPIPHCELLKFGEHFDIRICIDLSRRALQVARTKLGDRGIYLQGDLTNLPIQDDSVDAVTCNHVIYQIPPGLQKRAFLELYRVLKPGGVAVIIYWWPHAPLAWRIERLVRLFSSPRAQPVRPDDQSGPPHNPLPRSWFEQQRWPFRHDYDTFRVVTNHFTKCYVRDDFAGRFLLHGLYALQVLAPRYCGRHGAMPAIIIRK